MALKQGINALRGLRYKHEMMGILISGSMDIFGENVSGGLLSQSA